MAFQLHRANVGLTLRRDGGTLRDEAGSEIEEQPDDATCDEILRELAFERMVERGLADVRAGRTISDEEMQARAES